VPGGLAGWSAFALRAGVPVGGGAVNLTVSFPAAGGGTISKALAVASPPGENAGGPGRGAAKTVLSGLRVDLSGADPAGTAIAVSCGGGTLQAADALLAR
jgi:hypothetical protein